MTELENAHERINQLEDLLGCAQAHIEGDAGYESREAILGYIRAYWEARKSERAGTG